jgi:hypothetical protein
MADMQGRERLWKCSAARDLPIARTDSWDGQEAQDHIFAWAGWPGEPDPGKAAQAFLAHDAADPKLKGSYKLPFADVIGGELKASSAGLRAAASRLPQTDGLPQDVRDDARKVLDAYFEKLDGGEGGKDGRSIPLYAHPARILLPHPHMHPERVARLHELARQRALDPKVFDDHPPFFFPAEISNNRVDAYYTRMHPSSLKNFARDAEKGVSLQDSHRTDQLGLGASLTGKYEEGREDGLSDGAARTLAEFYTMQGLPDTDPFITRVRGGIAKDVSIGFYPLEDGTGQPFQFRCSVCDRDMLRDPACEHIPGLPYPIYDREGNETGQQTATAWVHNAHLAEVSPVYDGATPGAAIIKASQEAEAGRMKPEVARMLEARYRIKLPGAGHVWQLAYQQHDSDRMDRMSRDIQDKSKVSEDILSIPQNPVNPVNERAAQREAETLHEQLRAQAGQIKALAAEVDTLRAQAADGAAYRKDLIAAAMAEGVRALGDKFTPETYRAVLEVAPIVTIKRMRDDWKQLGDQRFPGRRQTVDTDPRETGKNTPTKREPVVPASAYQG